MAATMAHAASAPSANMPAERAAMRTGFAKPFSLMAFITKNAKVRAAATEMPRISAVVSSTIILKKSQPTMITAVVTTIRAKIARRFCGSRNQISGIDSSARRE
jgi:hypothetical protein